MHLTARLAGLELSFRVPAIIVALLLMQLSRLATHGAELTTLYSFSGPDGSSPSFFTQGNDGNIYGTTSDGGPNGLGTAYKLTPSGQLTTLHAFSQQDATGRPSSLIQGRDGNFYGVGLSRVYKLTPSGTVAILCDPAVSGDVLFPLLPIIQGDDGDLYGTAYSGGGNSSQGVVFRLTLTGALTIIHTFSGPDGSYPIAALTQASDGNFYGLTSEGGVGCGTVFRISPGGTFTNLHNFSAHEGCGPTTLSLVQGMDGNLYGATETGGQYDQGVIFRIALDGSITTLYSLSGVAKYPVSLIQNSDGSFYGVTLEGGTNNYGTIFRLTPANEFTVIHSFSGPDGHRPTTLIVAADGSIFGTTEQGGTANDGTIYSLRPGNSGLISLSVHPVPTAAILAAGTDSVDAALPVRPSDTLLKTTQPSLSGGLVANGVTPLLIELDTNPSVTQSTIFHLGISNIDGGGLATGTLDQYLRVLDQSGTSAQFIVGSSVVLSPSHPSGFAYISGIKSDDIQFADGSKELTVTLSATQDGGSTPAATVQFRIRKPPIVLVHGYNSDNGA